MRVRIIASSSLRDRVRQKKYSTPQLQSPLPAHMPTQKETLQRKRPLTAVEILTIILCQASSPAKGRCISESSLRPRCETGPDSKKYSTPQPQSPLPARMPTQKETLRRKRPITAVEILTIILCQASHRPRCETGPERKLSLRRICRQLSTTQEIFLLRRTCTALAVVSWHNVHGRAQSCRPLPKDRHRSAGITAQKLGLLIIFIRFRFKTTLNARKKNNTRKGWSLFHHFYLREMAAVICYYRWLHVCLQILRCLD